MVDLPGLADLLAGADGPAPMDPVHVDARLEAVVAGAVATDDPFAVWNAIDLHAGRADGDARQRLLAELRTRFSTGAIDTLLSDLGAACVADPQAGWQRWLQLMARAMVDMRMGLCLRLCDTPLGLPANTVARVRSLRAMLEWMRMNCWREAYEGMASIAAEEQALAGVERARLLAMLGQIRLFYFEQQPHALAHMRAALDLAPGDAIVLGAMGDYRVATKEYDAARQLFEQASTAAPERSDGYVGRGEVCEAENDLAGAEQWYREAMRTASGSSLGYKKLMRLFADKDLFPEREAQLLPLAERAIRVDPEGEYQVWLELGYVYEERGQYDAARRWYDKAVAIHPDWPIAYLAMARTSQRAGLEDECEAQFITAVRMRPDYDDGYFGLCNLYEQQSRWQDSLNWLEKVPQYREEWAAALRVRIGDMHARLGRHAIAEPMIKDGLTGERSRGMARSALERIAGEYYREHGMREAALRLYGEIHALSGADYTGTFHDRIGDMHLHFGEAREAIAQYRLAIEAAPANAGFRRDLSAAYRTIRDYDAAAQALRDALDVDGNRDAYNRELAFLCNEHANVRFAAGAYHESVSLYEEAIRHDAGWAVIHANLAHAWECITAPDGRLAALESAVSAYEQAERLSASEEYRSDLERVRLKRTVALAYGAATVDLLNLVSPIAVEVARDLIPFTENSAGGGLAEPLASHVAGMRGRIERSYGVPLPGVRFRGNESDMPTGSYLIMLNEVPLVMGTVSLDRRFCPATAADLAALGVDGEAASPDFNGHSGFWIRQADWNALEAAGIPLWDLIEYPVRHLESVLVRNLVEFLGHQEVANLAARGPDGALAARPGELTALTTVCRALAGERVGITAFDVIRRAMNESVPPGGSCRDRVRDLRLHPELRPSLPGNDGRHTIIPIAPELEQELSASLLGTGAHAVLAMEPHRCQDVLAAIRGALDSASREAMLVDSPDLRPYLRALVELEFPEVPVLARAELADGLSVADERRVELDADAGSPAVDRRRASASVPADSRPAGAGAVLSSELPPAGITVRVGTGVVDSGSAADEDPAAMQFELMSQGLFYELGILLPRVQVIAGESLEPGWFALRIGERDLPPVAGLQRDEILVNASADRLALLDISGRETAHPASGNPCTIVRAPDSSSVLDICQQMNLTVWGPAGFLVLSAAAAIRRDAPLFQSHRVSEYMLSNLGSAFPDLVRAARDRFSSSDITLVLRDLLEEQISIRDLRSILENMLAVNGTTDVDWSRFIVFAPGTEMLCGARARAGVDALSPADYAAFVRSGLRRYISHKYTRGANTLVVHLIDPDIEARIADPRPLDDDERARLRAGMAQELGDLASPGTAPVLLTSIEIRKRLRGLLVHDFPGIVVLAYQELSPNLNIQPVSRIEW